MKGQYRINIEEYNKIFQEFSKSDSFILSKGSGPKEQYTSADIRTNQIILTKFSELLDATASKTEDYIKNIKIKQTNMRETPSLIQDTRFEKEGGIYEACIKILMEELEKALGKCPEYQISTLAEPLREAFSNPEIIYIKLSDPYQKDVMKGPKMGRGYEEITIRALEVAGKPEDLSNAIKATRASLGYGDKLTGKKATNAWYNGLYRIAREHGQIIKMRKGWSKPRRDAFDEERRTQLYYRIIRTRLEELKGKPAYWYLLNYGNSSAKLSSDKGGTGMPSNPPTHFVDTALVRIKKIIFEMNVAKPYISPTYVDYRKDPRYADFTTLIETAKGNASYIKDLARQVYSLKALFARLESNIQAATNADQSAALTTDEIKTFQALSALDTMVDTILNSKVKPLRINEKLTADESQLVEYRLNKFIAEVLADKPVPARLYIISKDNVELKLRTKTLVTELEKDIQEYRKNFPGEIIERIFLGMSATVTEMIRQKQKQSYLNMLAKKGKL
jgi:hypothetical protein